MSSKHSYDVIVIGAGTAGFSAVEAARFLGASVCLIEKERLGGAFANDACIPSKALLRAAEFYRSLQDAKRFGVSVGTLSFQFADIMRYRESVVDQRMGGKSGEYSETRLKELGVDFISGIARFEDDHLVSVGSEQMYGKAIVVATGSVDYVPQIVGLDAIHYLTRKDVLSKERQSKSIAIIGGGPAACEIATFYAAFGTRVVLLQSAVRLLPEEDEECSKIIEEQMRRSGIEVVTKANITEIVDGRGGVYGVKVTVDGVPTMHAVENVVLAAGKRFNGNELGIEEVGVKCPDLGFIKVSKEQETNVSHIFAAGDACGNDFLTYTAKEEGAVAGYNAARVALHKRVPKHVANERTIPHVTFVEPELASVGLTAEDVKKRFSHVFVGRCAYSELDRSFTDHELVGLIKLVAHPTTHKILGGHIVGANAGEMIHEIALAIHLNATSEKLSTMMHAYPTYAEGIRLAARRMKTE